jgi:hypothetical protein
MFRDKSNQLWEKWSAGIEKYDPAIRMGLDQCAGGGELIEGLVERLFIFLSPAKVAKIAKCSLSVFYAIQTTAETHFNEYSLS